ncbi:hypothetical protein [Streptomyces sp. NPDC004728]
MVLNQEGPHRDPRMLAYETPRAGWEPELLRALDRAARLARL